MKKLFLSLAVCLAGSALSGADLQSSIDKLAGDDYRARKDGRTELKVAFAMATAPDAAAAELSSMEKTVIASLQSGKLPLTSQLYLLRVLELYGSENSAEAVYGFLGDPEAEVRDSARRALSSIPGDKAMGYLLAGLQKGAEGDRAAYVNALAERADPAAAKELVAHLQSRDEVLVAKVASALGKLGNADAVPELLAAHKSASTSLKPEIESALLDLGLDEQTAYLLAGTGRSFMVRADAFSQLIELNPVSAKKVLAAVIKQPEFIGRSLFFEVALNSSQEELHDLVVDYLPSAAEGDQTIIVASVGENDYEQYEAQVLALMSHQSKSLRLVAIDTLGNIGRDASFELLYEAFLADSKSDTIANAVARLQAPSADSKALAVVRSGSDVSARVASMKVLELRNVKGATDLLNEIAQNERDEKVRSAAFKVLENLGNLETIKICVDLILSGDSQTRALQSSLKRVSLNFGAPDSQWDAVYGPALEALNGAKAGEELVLILDGIQGPKALKYLEECVMNVDSELRNAALRNLQRWTDVSVADVWLKLVASEGCSSADVATAQKAIVKILKVDDRGIASQQVKLAVEAVQQGPSKEFKMAILRVYEKTPRHQKRYVKGAFKAIQDGPDVGATVKQLINSH